jgi:hypothetical protein
MTYKILKERKKVVLRELKKNQGSLLEQQLINVLQKAYTITVRDCKALLSEMVADNDLNFRITNSEVTGKTVTIYFV